MIGELRAVTLVPGLEPNARNAGEKRLAAGGCLQACTGKDRVSCHTGGAPALRPGAIAQSLLSSADTRYEGRLASPVRKKEINSSI